MNRWAIGCVASVALICAVAHAQAGRGAEGVRGGDTPSNPGFLVYAGAPFPVHPQDTRYAAEERQRKIQEDTQRIQQLSTELQAAIQQAGPDKLSLDAVKKAQEIEHLAKEVRVLMKQ